MLDSAVKFLADEVNQYLQRRTASNVVQVVPGGLTDDSGKWAVKEGAIGLALVNVEEERVLRSQVPDRAFVNGSHIVRQPELKLNPLVVFAARPNSNPNPNPYVQSLRYLSYILTYFQAHPVFTPGEYPALDAGIEKLTVELISYGPEQLNQLWAYIGTKYLPSVIYRVRMVVLQEGEPQAIGQPITTLESVLNDQ
jgi:hypothetical protein